VHQKWNTIYLIKMTNSRLYYSIKELPVGILNFHYYTDEISENFVDLKSRSKKINQQEVSSILHKLGIKNMLYSINKAEFSRLVKEVAEYQDFIDKLGHTDAIEANIATSKLWGTIELKRKFIEWFEKNGYSIPNEK